MGKEIKAIVGCEESQVITKAMRRRGIEAYSCDLQDCSGGHPEWHIKGDIRDHFDDGWDIGIFHPDCTRLTNAANRWLYEDCAKETAEERIELREKDIEFFIECQNAPIDKIAVENPEPHPYVIERVGRYTDKVQPWMFGDPETKAVCWWLKNLPPLMSTIIESKRSDIKFRLPPSKERAKLRGKFFPGMADAIAEQWG